MKGIAPVAAPKKGKKGKGKGKGPRTWEVDIPVLARSLIKAGDELLVTGPKKIYDEKEMIQRLPDPEAQKAVAQQAAELESSGMMVVVGCADGKVLRQAGLDFAPTWDGVAVAEESIFISGKDGVLYRLK